MRRKLYSIFYSWYIFTQISTLAIDPLSFPHDFLFGASTAAYQIEGAWNVDGKGESIWDRYTHTQPNEIKDRSNGDFAAESYYLYKKDSTLLKDIGFDVYRFSISWSRILPNGDLSEINELGIQHYHELIDDLVEKNIEPMVIIYHWDLPQKLEEMGGWLNSSIADHIEKYADILFSRFGDRVKFWNTINEAVNVVKGYVSSNTLAPSLGLGTPADYIVVHNILLAHARIYRLYEKKYKKFQKGKISITLDYETCFPKTPTKEDVQAAERNFQFMVGIFAHPIYSKKGDYPKIVKEIVYKNSMKEGLKQSRLPALTDEQKRDLLGSADYFSLNHYTSFICSNPFHNHSKSPDAWNSFFSADMHVVLEQDPFLPKTGEQLMRVDPRAFRVAVMKISMEYDYPDIFVTENGYSDLSPFADIKRIMFHELYLQQLLLSIKDGCKVIGYTVWSLIDNFQWLAGYTSKFGIVRVDFNSTEKTRTRKLSSYWFQELLRIRKIPNYQTFIDSARNIYETFEKLYSDFRQFD